MKIHDQPFCVFWFRRDLRLDDNAGFYHALKSGLPVAPVFIFDTEILSKLADEADARVTFIYNEVSRLKAELEELGATLWVFHGTPAEVYENLLAGNKELAAVYTNRDYEPYAKLRDEKIAQICSRCGVEFLTSKDTVIFEWNEVLKDDGAPYTVFTPYRTKWLKHLNDFYLKPYPNKKYYKNLLQHAPAGLMSLKALGFVKSDREFPTARLNHEIVSNYDKTRDFPGIRGTTRMSLHLRFGTVSIRKLAGIAREKNFTWLSELVWRDFYQMILAHFPHTEHASFKPAYDRIRWRNNEDEFKRWCEGQTGYPIVDAGMRELNETGFMHNRVRMIVASFLVKHLLIDWRWGERYFAEKLLDYEMASNVGGWQWAAGCGCDAAPYFRVFNPELQTKKFDPDHAYIKKWVPEYQELTYVLPVVDHVVARERVLKVFKTALAD